MGSGIREDVHGQVMFVQLTSTLSCASPLIANEGGVGEREEERE